MDAADPNFQKLVNYLDGLLFLEDMLDKFWQIC